MDTKPATLTGAPPRLFNSIIAGFNTVANHIQLILIPVALDLFIWLGPHLRVKDAFQPVVNDWLQSVAALGSAEMNQLVISNRQTFQSILEKFNMFDFLRSFPIGVPSLMAWTGEMANPLGQVPIQEASSLGSAFVTWVLIVLAGIALGSIYFNTIAYFSADRRMPVPLGRRAMWGFVQSVSLTLILVIGLLTLGIPAILVLSIFVMINAGVAQFVLLIMGFFFIWLLIPLVFSPHGIFAYGLNAIASLLTSARLVRRFLPATGLFFLLLILLSEGLDIVWHAAPSNSWMTLIGIGGHAFITTSLVAASFIYYQGGMRWMQENLQKMVSNPKAA
jgi:hypothetical protein